MEPVGQEPDHEALTIAARCPRCGRNNVPAVRIERTREAVTAAPAAVQPSRVLICCRCGGSVQEKVNEGIGKATRAAPPSPSLKPEKLRSATTAQMRIGAGFTDVVGNVLIDCPACSGQSVPATAYKLHEFLIPFLLNWTTSWVICHTCGERLLCKCDAHRLKEMSPEQSRKFLRFYIPLDARIATVIACLTFFLPLMGLIMGAFALMTTLRVKSRLKWWARGAFILSCAFHVLFWLLLRD